MGAGGQSTTSMCSKNRAHSAKALPHEIRRAQAHPARLQSAMGEIAGQKIVFAGGQFVAGIIRQAGANERMGKDREYLPGFPE